MSLRKYTKEWLEELCKESYSYAEVLKKAGRKQGGGAQATLKQKINEFNIDVSHFTGQKWTLKPSWEPQTGLREKYSLEDIFKKNSFISQKVLRGYIERHNLLEYRCQNCGCDGSWMDGEIALELHHIDGDTTNNELSNLQYLCPNCHALTKNYRGKNKALKLKKLNV